MGCLVQKWMCGVLVMSGLLVKWGLVMVLGMISIWFLVMVCLQNEMFCEVLCMFSLMYDLNYWCWVLMSDMSMMGVLNMCLVVWVM